jgi:redox-regulated HSP33 family molecular chaperone
MSRSCSPDTEAALRVAAEVWMEHHTPSPSTQALFEAVVAGRTVAATLLG